MAYNEKGYSYQPRSNNSQRQDKVSTQVNADARVKGNYDTSSVDLHPTVYSEAGKSKFAATTAALGNFLSIKGQEMQKEAAERNIMLGIRRAQMGESMEEIRESQPFWHKWTGDSDVVKGAATYVGKSAALSAQREMQANIEYYASLDEVERERQIISMYDKQSPQDAYASLIYSSEVMGMQAGFSNLLANHVQRANVETFSREMTATLNNAGGHLQDKHNAYIKGDLTPEAYNQEMQNYFSLLEIPEGIERETVYGALTGSIVENAKAGNFIAYKALKETNHYAMLPPEHRAKLDADVEAIAKTTGLSMVYSKYADEIHDMQNRRALGTVSTQRFVEWQQELNDSAKHELGYPIDVFTGKDTVAANDDTAAALKAAQSSKAKNLTKEQHRANSVQEFTQQAIFGTGYSEAKDKQLYHEVVTAQVTAQGSKKIVGVMEIGEEGLVLDHGALNLLANNYKQQGYINPNTKIQFARVSSIINNGTYEAELDTVFLPNFMALVESNNLAMAEAYLGRPAFDFMMAYTGSKINSAQGMDGGDSAQAIFNETVARKKSHIKLNEKETKRLTKDVVANLYEYTSTGMLLWESNNIGASSKGQVEGLVGAYIQDMPDYFKANPEMAGQYLTEKVNQASFNTGDFVVFNNVNDGVSVGTLRIDNLIRNDFPAASPQDIGAVINSALLDRLKGAYGERNKNMFTTDKKLKNIDVLHAKTARNEEGKVTLNIAYMDTSDKSGNSVKVMRIAIDEVQARARAHYKRITTTKKPLRTVFDGNEPYGFN